MDMGVINNKIYSIYTTMGAKNKNQAKKEDTESWGPLSILNRVVRGCFTGQLTVYQRSNGIEDRNQADGYLKKALYR